MPYFGGIGEQVYGVCIEHRPTDRRTNLDVHVCQDEDIWLG